MDISKDVEEMDIVDSRKIPVSSHGKKRERTHVMPPVDNMTDDDEPRPKVPASSHTDNEKDDELPSFKLIGLGRGQRRPPRGPTYASTTSARSNDGWEKHRRDRNAAQEDPFETMTAALNQLTPPLLEQISRGVGTKYIDDAWWQEALQACGANVALPEIFKQFQICRVSIVAGRLLKNYVVVDNRVPVEKVPEKLDEYCREHGQVSIFRKPDGSLGKHVDVEKKVAVRVDPELMAKNLVFHTLCTFGKERRLIGQFRASSKETVSRPRMLFEPNEWWNALAPNLFPEADDGYIDSIFEMTNTCVGDKVGEMRNADSTYWMYRHNLPLPPVVGERNANGRVPTAYAEFGDWIIRTDVDINVYNTLARTAFHGPYKLNQDRVVASLINKWAHEKDIVGGKLTEKILRWLQDFKLPIQFAGSGALPPMCSAQHRTLGMTDNEMYRTSTILIYPDSVRQANNNKPRILIFPVNDHSVWLNLDTWLKDQAKYAVYFVRSDVSLVVFHMQEDGDFFTGMASTLRAASISIMTAILMREADRYVGGFDTKNLHRVYLHVAYSADTSPIVTLSVDRLELNLVLNKYVPTSQAETVTFVREMKAVVPLASVLKRTVEE